MAETSEADDKTDQISERRVRQAYDEGQMPVGRDAIALAGMVGGTLALVYSAAPFTDALVRLVQNTLTSAASAPYATLWESMARALVGPAQVCAAGALLAASATLAQTRGGFWPELALPDVSRMTQGKLSRLLKREFVVDLGLSALKVTAVGWVAYLALRDEFMTLPKLLDAPAATQVGAIFEPLGKAAVKVLTVMAILAGADLAVAHLRFRSKMKMTPEEAKREYKEDEGDPLMRMRRKKRSRELAKGRVAVEVPRADAVLVNPTHVAVAIRYRRDEGRAPKVIAKGKGQLAEIMRDLARANGIPIVEDIPLTRLLYRRVKVGGQVPAETYKAVAAVLAFVYRVTGRVQGQQPGALR